MQLGTNWASVMQVQFILFPVENYLSEVALFRKCWRTVRNTKRHGTFSHIFSERPSGNFFTAWEMSSRQSEAKKRSFWGNLWRSLCTSDSKAEFFRYILLQLPCRRRLSAANGVSSEKCGARKTKDRKSVGRNLIRCEVTRAAAEREKKCWLLSIPVEFHGRFTAITKAVTGVIIEMARRVLSFIVINWRFSVTRESNYCSPTWEGRYLFRSKYFAVNRVSRIRSGIWKVSSCDEEQGKNFLLRLCETLWSYRVILKEALLRRTWRLSLAKHWPMFANIGRYLLTLANICQHWPLLANKTRLNPATLLCHSLSLNISLHLCACALSQLNKSPSTSHWVTQIVLHKKKTKCKWFRASFFFFSHGTKLYLLQGLFIA